jgi:hypothetical protein
MVIGVVALLVFAGGGVFGAVRAAASVRFDCERAQGECHIVTTYPVVGARTKGVPLASIQSTTLRSTRTKNVTTYAVDLRTKDGGATPLSQTYGDLGPRTRQKQAIDAFLASPTAPSLALDYDQGRFSALPFVIFGLMVLGVAYFMGLRATLRFDGVEGMLHIEKGTWGWVRKRTTIPLGEIRGFDVKEQRGAKGGTVYGTVIVLNSGKTIDPLGVLSSGRRSHEDMANRMRVAFVQACGTPSSPMG